MTAPKPDYVQAACEGASTSYTDTATCQKSDSRTGEDAQPLHHAARVWGPCSKDQLQGTTASPLSSAFWAQLALLSSSLTT